MDLEILFAIKEPTPLRRGVFIAHEMKLLG